MQSFEEELAEVFKTKNKEEEEVVRRILKRASEMEKNDRNIVYNATEKY